MKTRKKKNFLYGLLVGALMAVLSDSAAFAGVRAAGPTLSSERSENNAADEFQRNSKPEAAKGLTQVTIRRSAGITTLINRSGVTDQINLEPEESVNVEVTRPGLKPGTRVYAFTLHGGRINGHLTESLIVNEEGRIAFVFSANKWFGNYPLVLRINGNDEEVGFWVKRQRENSK